MAVVAYPGQKGGLAPGRPGFGGKSQMQWAALRGARNVAQFSAVAPRFLGRKAGGYIPGKGMAFPAYSAPRFTTMAASSLSKPPQPGLPLDGGTIDEIREYLQQCGGAAALGKLATLKPGLKKVQLEPHFHVEMPPGANTDFIVSLDGTLGPLTPGEAAQPSRKRQRNEQMPAELPDLVVQEIRKYVQEFGGIVPLGNLTTAFEGVKKIQLTQAGFGVRFGELGEKEYMVTADAAGFDGPGPGEFGGLGGLQGSEGLGGPAGWEGPGVHGGPRGLEGPGGFRGPTGLQEAPDSGGLMGPELSGGFDSQAIQESKKKRKRKEYDPSAAPPEPLEAEAVQAIDEFLRSSGGSLSLGKLTTKFEGLKKVQLEPHFMLLPDPRGPSNGDFLVCVRSDWGLPLDQPFAMDSGPGAVLPLEAPIPPVDAQVAAKKKKPKPKRDPDAPPPPDLEKTRVDEIAAYLQLRGGCALLGRLTTDFPGVKKVQLAPHFVVCGDPAVDLSICLDVATAIANGFQQLSA